MEDDKHSAQQHIPEDGSEPPNHHHHHHHHRHHHHHHHHHRDSSASKRENANSASSRGSGSADSKESLHGVPSAHSPGTKGLAQSQPQDCGAAVEDLGRYGGRIPQRQRHHEVRCLNVLVYYGIVVSTFLLYSVGFIAYKLDENPDEVREFYRTITTEQVPTIFTRTRTRPLERGDHDVTSDKCRSGNADGCTSAADRLSLAAGTVTEDEQWRRYIIVPSLPMFTGFSQRASSPPEAASGNYSLQAQDASQADTGDPFVHLLQAVASHEKARRRSSRQHAPAARAAAGANTTVAVPFLTFPGLSHW
ncbi:uncharacterized protein LOC144129957 [Amblyomma americanum]